MNKIKMFTVMTLTSMMGVAGIAAGSSRISFVSKAAVTPRTYDIVSLIAEQLDSSQEFQDVTITVDGFDFMYRTRNASKVIVGGKTTIEITNGYIYNFTTLNGLNYVDVGATQQNAKGTIALGKAYDISPNDEGQQEYYETVLCENGVKDSFGKFNAVDNACSFSVVTKDTVNISKLEISYTCNTGDSNLLTPAFDSLPFPDEFKIYIDPSADKVLNIATLQDFIDFSSQTRQPISSTFSGWTINLLNDLIIDKSIFANESVFCGTFNGNNHLISYSSDGTSSYIDGQFSAVTSLFSRIGEGAIFKNLNLDATITSETFDAGCLATTMTGTSSNKIKLDNVNVTGTLISDKDDVGGIVGSAEYVEFKGCSFGGKLNEHRQVDYVGGIVGYSGGNLSFQSCELKSTAEIEGRYKVGGIVGHQASSDVIDSCSTYGSINAYDNVGGISGESTGSISSCTSCVNIVGRQYVGGIVGKIEEYSGDIIEVYNCTYNGSLKSSSTCVGGIVGSSNGCDIKLCECKSETTITLESTSSSIYAGGIVGYTTGTFVVSGCTYYRHVMSKYTSVEIDDSANYKNCGYLIGRKGSTVTSSNNTPNE